MSYSILIIGAGNKGALADAPGSGNEHKYLSYAHAVKDLPGFELCGFVDNDYGKAMYARNLWDIAYYSDSICNIHGFLKPNMDIAIICTPDDTHYDILKQLADYPLKLVICEKPLCIDLQQAREIVELYRQKNIPILCDYTRRFIPEYQQMKAEIDAGKWGAFLEGYGYFNRGWLHTGSHMVDFVLWMRGTMDGFRIREVKTDYRWIYQIGLFYEKDFFQDAAVNFVKNPHVDSIFDKHLWYVMENVWNFLEGKEPLLCTGEDALMTLEECYKLMEAGK
jgi:predicted dehydrogenase